MSEVYSLHRQTAYLAQDYFDRFMLTQENVNKDYLQLIGITSLFIASKIEVSLYFLFLYIPVERSVYGFTMQRLYNVFFSSGNLST